MPPSASPVAPSIRDFPLMACRPIQRRQLSPYRELYAQGVRVLHVDATFAEDYFHPELRAWKAPDTYEYSVQEAHWHTLLAACPEARLCLRLYAGSPPWWDEQHPAELQRYADGSVEANFQRINGRHTLPSLASAAWRADACAALARFLRWLESSGWAPRIWGFLLSYGITWEWGILGTDRHPDYSAPMQTRFREWLRTRYRDVDHLHGCWGDPAVDFATAAIPALEQRLACEGDLRRFPRDRAASDFQQCLSDTNCDLLLALGRTVREVSGSRYKLGAWYGYTLTAREQTAFTGLYGAGGLAGGHHALGRFLRSGLFDFNVSPYAYANRDLGHGALIQHFPRASTQRHGVHVYDENDLRTFLVAGLADDRAISIGQTRTLDDTLDHQRWAIAQSLCHASSSWWTELSDWIGPYKPYYDHPAILAELRQHIASFQLHAPNYAPMSAEIALIIDEHSIAALGLSSKLFLREIYEQLAAWAWCGAPFDVWLAEDVTPDTMRTVKLAYVFAPAPAENLRVRLAQTLCRDARTVWWGPLSGLLTDHGTAPAAFTELTGHQDPHDTTLRAAEVGPAWRSLYGAAAGLTPEDLARIARDAGVHLYGPAPLHVMRGGQFTALQTRANGSLPMRIPPGETWTWLESDNPFSSDHVFTAGRTELLRHRPSPNLTPPRT